MDTLQTWIVVGVPGLLLASALFIGRSTMRAVVGFMVLLGLVVTFTLVPGSRLSAAGIGLLMVLLVANGRAQTDRLHHEHHEHRERFTIAGG